MVKASSREIHLRQKIPTSLEELTAGIRQLQPERSVDEIRSELNDFGEQIIKQGPCHLLVPYGKAFFLFQEMLQYLARYDFTYGTLKALYYPERILAKNVKRASRDQGITILVDSIRKGKEAEDLYGMFQGPNEKISRIYSFLTNSRGLKHLKSTHFPVEKVVSHKIVGNAEYADEYDKIYIYLQSRIDPLVEGAPFDVYLTRMKMEEGEFLEFATNAISSALRCRNFKLSKDDWLHTTKGIHCYSYDCDAINTCHNNDDLFADIPNIQLMDFEAAKYGVKVECRENGITFRIATLSPVTCKLNEIVPMDSAKCPYSQFAPRGCEVKRFPVKQRKAARRDVCPVCLTLVVSFRVLDLIKKEIDNSLKKKNITFTSRRTIPF